MHILTEIRLKNKILTRERLLQLQQLLQLIQDRQPSENCACKIVKKIWKSVQKKLLKVVKAIQFNS